MNLFKRLFSKEPDANNIPTLTDVIGIISPNYPATESREIKLLSQLRDKRSLMEVTLPGSFDTYQTIILDINIEDKYLTVDEFFPAPSSALMQMGAAIQLKHQYDGRVIKFKSQILAKSNSDGIPYYALSLPTTITSGQRRSHQRVNIPKDSGLKVTCLSPKRTRWFATVKNISVEGIKLDLAGNLTDELYRNIVLNDCEIELPTKTKVKCQLEVKNFHYDRAPYKHTFVGARLVSLSPTMKEEINQFVLEQANNLSDHSENLRSA